MRLMNLCYLVWFGVAIALTGCFDSRDQNTKEVQTVVLAETTRSWDGELLPPYPTGQPKVSILRITVPPHARLDMHKHSIINAAVVTKGQLTVVKESGEELTIQAGEALVEVIGSFHYGMNPGDEPTEIIVFYAGDEDTPLSEKRTDTK